MALLQNLRVQSLKFLPRSLHSLFPISPPLLNGTPPPPGPSSWKRPGSLINFLLFIQVLLGFCRASGTAELPSRRPGFSPCSGSCFTRIRFQSHLVFTDGSGVSSGPVSPGDSSEYARAVVPLMSVSVRAAAEARRMGREDANRGLQSSKTHKQTAPSIQRQAVRAAADRGSIMQPP